jgi:peptidoglycan hydrolase-like protein with peptidoglycan-binding domain
MLGYRIAVEGDKGAETRQVVTSFQMRTGIVADGVAGAQTEAKLLGELNRMRETDGHLPRSFAAQQSSVQTLEAVSALLGLGLCEKP